ncbi:hypothetical protein LT17_06856 [Pseudomonas aeruginosa]|nr:hypothetical protein LT17_06856 [Pseudomonas aeruginosa]
MTQVMEVEVFNSKPEQHDSPCGLESGVRVGEHPAIAGNT